MAGGWPVRCAEPPVRSGNKAVDKPVPADAAFGQDSGSAARTVAVRITIGDGAIGLDEITQ